MYSLLRHVILYSVVCKVFLTQNFAYSSETDLLAKEKFFEDRIRPVLIDQCISCHGKEKQKGGLRLDSLAGMLRGGDSGKAIVPGDPKASLLIVAIDHVGELKMPPKGKLSSKVRSDFGAWIKDGSVWPVAVNPKSAEANANIKAEQKPLWSFQPINSPQVPNGNFENPLDRFVFAKLEQMKLKPAKRASQRQLIRRAYFDLLGLPPSPEEVDHFLKDQSPQAWSKLIDRLLASPLYGERWARHWLDVARYADSNGMDENLSHENAWRYRNWVIASLKNDLPFNDFIKMQIAGDLIEPDRPESYIPTGFLMIGPKMLAEDDPVKMQMDIIDEQIDTLGQAFLGMTFGCARCHDHKFDPISMKDYYALAGIFKSTKTMSNFSVVAQWQELPIANKSIVALNQELDSKIKDIQSKLSAVEKEAKSQLMLELRKQAKEYVSLAESMVKLKAKSGGKPFMGQGKDVFGSIVVEAEAFQKGNVLKVYDGYGLGIGVLVNAGTIPNEVEYDINVIHDGDYVFEVRYAAQEKRPTRLVVDQKPIADIAINSTGSWNPDGQRWEQYSILQLTKGKHRVRLQRNGPFPHIDKFALIPLQGSDEIKKNPIDHPSAKQLHSIFINQWVEHLEKNQVPKNEESFAKLINDPSGPFRLPEQIDDLIDPERQKQIVNFKDQILNNQKQKRAFPMAMSVSEGKAENLKIHIRGSHLNLGLETSRGFPAEIIKANKFSIPPTASGRRELADWLTHPSNPLTARVAVNRVWTWHFGDGLVRTPDNFGRLGDSPVHAELLDWLASQFVERGWSMKQLHRLIMNSETYQMSTQFDSTNHLTDPENRYLWRWNRRRLDAESFRDALLSVSGALDKTPAESLLKIPNRAYVTSTANRNFDGYDSNKRSIYLPVIRSAGYEPFMALDFPDPSVSKGKRSVTNIPAQALLLMNGKLVSEQVNKLANRLVAMTASDQDRLSTLYQLLFSRFPTSLESERATRFVMNYELAAKVEKIPQTDLRLSAWCGLVRTLISSNDFMFVE